MQKMGSKTQKKLVLQSETIRAMQESQTAMPPPHLPTQPPICTSGHTEQCTRRC